MTSRDARDSFEAEPSELARTRILIVEDSWDVSQGLKMLLEAWGAEVVGPVATVDGARRLVSERIPDVALLDINLRNGERSYGFVDEMHGLGIPVVVITGYADVSPAQGKVAAILQKPFTDVGLLTTLRSMRSKLQQPR